MPAPVGVDRSKPHHAVALSSRELSDAVFQYLDRRGDIVGGGMWETTLTINSDGAAVFSWQRGKVTP